MPARRPRAAAAALAPLLVLALTACSSGREAESPPAGPSTEAGATSRGGEAGAEAGAVDPRIDYVALGDSYASAPGVPPVDVAGGCFRSGSNYAHVLAESVPRIALSDATCGGATSQSLLEQQLPALTEETDLVTVGIGGNDEDLFAELIAGCVGRAVEDPEGSPCTDEVGDLGDRLPQVAVNVGEVLDAILEAAPRAQVVVVGYPTLLPASGSCPELPIAAGDLSMVAGVNAGLSAILAEAAAARDLDFVDVAAASEGHDVCAEAPWINGAEVAPDGTAPFHPLAVEQAAVAHLIERFLS